MKLKEASIIDYKGEKVFIGIAKLPPIATSNKMGFMGVKLQKEDKSKILCYECGKWVKRINGTHLRSHNLNIEQYKEKYGFNKTTVLACDNSSLVMSKIMMGKKHSLANNKGIQKLGLKH